MIFGALQTLSEEACEDAMEEQEKRNDRPFTPSQLTAIPSGWWEGAKLIQHAEVPLPCQQLQEGIVLTHIILSVHVSVCVCVTMVS